jgi:OOP family OmpA-OmpF porin
VKAATSDTGLYSYNGVLTFYSGINGRDVAVTPNTWAQVALTRDRGGNVAGYVNGVEQFRFADDEGDATISAADTVRFFQDDSAVSGEQSAGAVARIRLYDRPLTAGEVAALMRLP